MKLSFQKYLQNSLSKIDELDFIGNPDVIVVIPAFNEPDIFTTYESLLQNKCNCEVLVLTIVNYSEKAEPQIKDFNKKLYDKIQLWNNENSIAPIYFKALLVADVRRKHAGAGYARKVGMDTATDIFYRTDNTQGIIASLDADCLVTSNYLASIFTKFKSEDKLDLQIIDFDHQKEGLNEQQLTAIIQYETYLHYYVLALRLAGFPFAYHTIGSTFALTVGAYVKNGGMNRKHAGEDFYFLHKLFPNARVYRNYHTTVYPSSRVSDRVPFGTGPALSQILNNSNEYIVYNPDAFDDLKIFFRHFETFFESHNIDEIQIGNALNEFLETISFDEKVEEARKNSNNSKSFVRRLFRHFDAFQIVKFLNYAHEQQYYVKLPIYNACHRLFDRENMGEGIDLLNLVRQFERDINLH